MSDSDVTPPSSSPSGDPIFSSTMVKSPPQGVDLLEIVRNGRVSLRQTATDWLDLYSVNQSQAMLHLVQLVFLATGFDVTITSSMLEGKEPYELMVEMETSDHLSDYVQISLMVGDSREGRMFRDNFTGLLSQVVVRSKNSILYDNILMDKLIGMFVSMSSSNVRVVRHTGCLAALNIVTALVTVTKVQEEQHRNTKRQLEAEKRKGPASRAADRMEVLGDKMEEMEQNQTQLGEMIDYIFKSVFVVRNKDIADDIRTLCIHEMGVWLKECPERFLKDSYLKYVGWSLYDLDSQVRLQSVLCLQPIYGSPHYTDKLTLFTEKFKDRIVLMTLDSDIDVSVEAVNLLTLLTRSYPEVLSDSDCEQVFLLIYSGHRKVGLAAGAFLLERLESRGGYSEMESTKSKRGKTRSRSAFLVRDILTFSVEVELENKEQFLVDSLVHWCPALTDWETFTDLLIEEVGGGEDMLELEDTEARELVFLMVASVKQAVEGQPPDGRDGIKKVMTANDQRSMRKAKESVTLCLVANLATLLYKYLSHPEISAKLFSLVQWMDVEQYTRTRQEPALDNLLELCREAIQLHSHSHLLASLSQAVELLCTPSLSIYSRCNTARSHILDYVAEQFRLGMEDFSSAKSTDRDQLEEESKCLQISLEKLCSLSPRHDLSEYGLWSSLLDIVSQVLQEDTVMDTSVVDHYEIAVLALNCCYYSLLWQLRMMKLHRNGRSKKRMRTGDVQERCDQFLTVCQEAVVTDGSLAKEAFTSVCDLLLLLGVSTPPPPVQEQEQQSVWIQVTQQTVERLGSFVEDLVLDEGQVQDDDFETVSNKRKMLASFCKLILRNVIPVKYFSLVLKHWVRHEDRFGDIIKKCLAELRTCSRAVCGRVMVQALCEELGAMEVVDRANYQFATLRQLSKKFALSLGLDPVRNRETLMAVHKFGIEAATSEGGKMELLELLGEFTQRISPQDKKVFFLLIFYTCDFYQY